MASRTSFMSKLTSAFILLCFIPFLFLSAGCKRENKALPILGNQDVVNGDTIRHIVPDYLLTDQDSQQIRISGYGNKIFLADFFLFHAPVFVQKCRNRC